MASGAVGVGLTLLQTLILVRLLSPTDFGLMAAAMIVVGLTLPIRDLGLTQAIVVRPSISRESLSSVYWLNILSGVVIGALVWASTPLLIGWFRQPHIASLMPWVGLLFATAPLGNVFAALMQRELRFEELARIDMLGAVAGFAVAVATAASGAGARALVFGMLAAAIVRVAIVMDRGRHLFRPMLRLRRSDLDGYLSFGGFQIGYGILNYAFSNLDYLLIGRFLGAHSLGAYSVAYQLVTRPQMQLNPILTRVATPVFAKRQTDNAALRRGYLEIVRLIGFVAMPLLAGMAVIAPKLVPVLFGPHWHDSIVPLQILSFVGIAYALGNPLGTLTLAKNRPDIEFKVMLITVPLTLGAILLVVHHGIWAVAAALLSINLLTLPVLLVVLRRLIGLRGRDYFAALRTPAAIAAGTAGATAVAYRLAGSLHSSGRLTVVVSVIAGAITCFILLAWREGAYGRELWAMLRAGRAADSQTHPLSGPLPVDGSASQAAMDHGVLAAPSVAAVPAAGMPRASA